MTAARIPSLINLALNIMFASALGSIPLYLEAFPPHQQPPFDLTPNIGSPTTRSHRRRRVAHRRPVDQISGAGSPRAQNSTRRRPGPIGPCPASLAGRPRDYILRQPVLPNPAAEPPLRTETPPHRFRCPIGKPRSPDDRLPACRTAWKVEPDPRRRHSVEANECPPSTAVRQGDRRAAAAGNAH